MRTYIEILLACMALCMVMKILCLAKAEYPRPITREQDAAGIIEYLLWIGIGTYLLLT
jgi:hypothetical protein